jgi:hypothetical protein
MKPSMQDCEFWAVGFLLTAALLGVLLGRGRWRQFPIFTLWMAYKTLLNEGSRRITP